MDDKKPFNPISGLPVQPIPPGKRKLYTIDWEQMAKVKDFNESFGFNANGKKSGFNQGDN